MSEYRPTEYVVDFGDCRSNRFVMLNMTLIKQNGAKLHERIVRCRDCVHDIDTPRRGSRCVHWMTLDCYENPIPSEVYPNGFCSWGERRTNDD